MPGSGPSRRPRSPCTFAQRLRKQILTSLLGHNHGLSPHPSPAGCSPRRCRLHLISPSATEAPARQLCSPKPLGLPHPWQPVRSPNLPSPAVGRTTWACFAKKSRFGSIPLSADGVLGLMLPRPPKTRISAAAGSCPCPPRQCVCALCGAGEVCGGGACACVHECACALQLGGPGGAQGPGRAALLLSAPGGECSGGGIAQW